MEKQYKECQLEKCAQAECECSCCDDDQVEEWVNEYFAYHERFKDYLKKMGVKIKFIGDRVRFTSCSDGKNCKFLKYSLNKDIDPRPIDCKIYPYTVDWDSIDFDKKIIKLFYWDDRACPLIKNYPISDKFKDEVKTILKRDFAFLFYGARFSIEFADKPRKNKKQFDNRFELLS